MDAVLRIAFDQQVHMVGHDFQLDDVASSFGGDLSDDLLETVGHIDLDNGAAIFGAPHDVIGAAVDDVVV